jgi:hypothetical protein
MRLFRCGFFPLCLMVAFCCLHAGADGVPESVFYRVLMIQTTVNGVDDQGTGFTLDVEGRQYLVTAKHMVAGLKSEDTIQVRKYDASGSLKWVPFKMKIFTCDDPVDIAVMVPREQLTLSGPMQPVGNAGGPVFGGDVNFVGFPLGMSMEITETTAELPHLTSPFGYVRRAMLSGLKNVKIGETTKTEYILDGHNLFGFSGSPVVYRGNDGIPRVMAVISSFRPDYGPVLTPKQIRPEEATAADYGAGRIVKKDGHTYRLEEPTEMNNERYVILNTGIAQAYDIRHAVDLIKLHEEGPKITADFKPSLAP